MIKQGTLPLAQKDKAIAAIQSGGKTVDELTGKLFSFRFIKIYFNCLVPFSAMAVGELRKPISRK